MTLQQTCSFGCVLVEVFCIECRIFPYGHSVTSGGCLTNSSLSIKHSGAMLNAYKYCKIHDTTEKKMISVLYCKQASS